MYLNQFTPFAKGIGLIATIVMILGTMANSQTGTATAPLSPGSNPPITQGAD